MAFFRTLGFHRFVLVLSCVVVAELNASVQLASPFSSHMVLQRELPVPIWGTAAPGDTVTVEFAGQKKSALTDSAGQWRVTLDPLVTNAEPHDLLVASVDQASAIQKVTLEDILVGEVWLASGQSNMDFTVAKTEKYYFAGVQNEAAEVAAANYPLIRMFTGEWQKAYAPQARVAGTWKVCTPENVREFSAIGYFFARDLQQDLHVPVGIVALTFGASCAQAWIRREAIEADATLKPLLNEFDALVKAYVPPSEEELKVWQVAVDQAKAEGKRAPRRPRPDPTQDQHNPTVMFNGMIAPVVGFALRGVIWYQGESITAPKELFPRWNETLITDWRKLWGRELPFYFCQLAAHDNVSNSPQIRSWQAEALKLPATGMAVTIDVGEAKGVHPRNKAPVGDRLARLALAHQYGREFAYSGPVYESCATEGDSLRLKFSQLAGGLVAKDGALKTFELAGADGIFAPAEAVIEGDTIVIRVAAIHAPVAARYAWSNYPAGCNLYNAAGLPAASFRTDEAR